MNIRITCALVLGLVPLMAVHGRVSAQGASEAGRYAAVLDQLHPDTHDLLLRLERVHGVMFGELAREREVVRATGAATPTFELETIGRLTDLVHSDGTLQDVAREAEEGYAVLGARAAGIIAWTLAFQREVIGILADPSIEDRRAALARAVARYESRSDLALPSAPKDMDVLYAHRHALHFRTAYAELDGLTWAGHWWRLAATEPFTDLTLPSDRAAGLDTVTTRYYKKLSYGEPPQFFPSEIPLAPAIAPGLIYLSAESAMIWDNLSMMQEVLADILASPEAVDVATAIDGAVEHFMDPTVAMTGQAEWEVMALRHGIFFQGGFPLAVMTQSERNGAGHAAHLGAAGGPVVMPGMPR